MILRTCPTLRCTGYLSFKLTIRWWPCKDRIQQFCFAVYIYVYKLYIYKHRMCISVQFLSLHASAHSSSSWLLCAYILFQTYFSFKYDPVLKNYLSRTLCIKHQCFSREWDHGGAVFCWKFSTADEKLQLLEATDASQ